MTYLCAQMIKSLLCLHFIYWPFLHQFLQKLQLLESDSWSKGGSQRTQGIVLFWFIQKTRLCCLFKYLSKLPTRCSLLTSNPSATSKVSANTWMKAAALFGLELFMTSAISGHMPDFHGGIFIRDHYIDNKSQPIVQPPVHLGPKPPT